MASDLEIRHLRALVAVAHEGGVSRAALALSISQSTVSEHLLALERSLGVKLTVRRSGRELTLSEAGRDWLPYAGRVLREVEAAIAAVGGRTSTTLRIGASESLGTFVLPPALNILRTHWPLLDIQVANGLCDGLRAGVRSDLYDLALTLVLDDASRCDRDGLVTNRLADARIAMIVRSDDRIAAGQQVSRSDLCGRTILTPDPDGELQRCLESYLSDVPGVSLRSAGTIGGVIAGVQIEHATAALPTYAFAPELRRGEIKELALIDRLPAFAIEAVTLTGTGSAPLQELVEILARHLRHHDLALAQG